jgi:hypothetical protein
MMPGILEMLQRVATDKGINYEEWFEGLKHKGQVGAPSLAGWIRGWWGAAWRGGCRRLCDVPAIHSAAGSGLLAVGCWQ